MYCTACGGAVSEGAKYCGQCGSPVSARPAPQEHQPMSMAASTSEPTSPSAEDFRLSLAKDISRDIQLTHPRPWRRFWAKQIDVWIICIGMAILWGLTFPEQAANANDTAAGIVMLALFVPVDALIMSTFGTTIGKALLGITVTNGGTRLTIGKAFNRSLNVWIKGLGLGIPIVSLFTMGSAYSDLKHSGRSSWDKDAGNVVSYRDIGAFSIIGAVAIFVIVVFLVGLGVAAEQGY